nr:amidohydrolase family protein [Flavihumibacter fluvii]
MLITMPAIQCQEPRIDFENYDPPSSLVVPEHPVKRAKFPFIDVHNHQYNMVSSMDQLVKDMDQLNLQVMVNLSGGSGSSLKRMAEQAKVKFPGRFIIFANLNYSGIGSKEWTASAVQQLEEDVRNGANGLKIFKDLGFSVKDKEGNRVTVDDPRLDPIWDKCAELKIPVLIHTADPRQFWQPIDERNERLLELHTHPGRRRSDDQPAPWLTLINEQHRMFKKHPGTIFIAAHFGWYANDLQHLDSLLTEMPNVLVEFGAVIAEIGRQPRSANAFFTKYQDRILFGKDSWVPAEYTTYFRVLETTDEYFPYHKKYHAFWRMYGLGLSDEILKKIYYKNAIRIIPQIDPKKFTD